MEVNFEYRKNLVPSYPDGVYEAIVMTPELQTWTSEQRQILRKYLDEMEHTALRTKTAKDMLETDRVRDAVAHLYTLSHGKVSDSNHNWVERASWQNILDCLEKASNDFLSI